MWRSLLSFTLVIAAAVTAQECPESGLVAVAPDACPAEGDVKRFKCTADDLVPGDLCTPGSKGECGTDPCRRSHTPDSLVDSTGTDPELNNCFYQGKKRDIYRVEGPAPTHKPSAEPTKALPRPTASRAPTPRPQPKPTPAPIRTTPQPTVPRPTPQPTTPPSPRPTLTPYPTTLAPTTWYEPTQFPTTFASTRPVWLIAAIQLERVAEEPLQPYDQALKVVSRAVAESVELCRRPSNVVSFAVLDVRSDQRRRLQRGDYTFQALLRVTVDVDACADYDFYDNDVCLEDMVADLDRASASGALVQALKYWADQFNVDMSPFIRARGVEESEWESVPDEDDTRSGSKKKKSADLPYGAYVFLVLVAVLIGLCCLAALAYYLYQACRDCACSCRNPCRRGVKNMGKGKAPRDYQFEEHVALPPQKREAEETKMAAEPVEVEAPPPVYEEPPPPSYDDRWRYGESFDAYDRRRAEPEPFRPRRTPSLAVVVKEPPKMMATPVPEDPLPTSPHARAAASSAAARRKLAATPRREDYDELHAEREAFERHVRSLMAKKARKDAARAAVALAAHERTVERASRRKAEIDARRGLAARTAERRQRRSASTSPAPDLAARTARRRAASTSPARRAPPDDLAARTAERRRRAGR